jgi:transposase
VVCNGQGKPVAMFLSEGQMSDYKGARVLLPSLPKAKTLIADRGYDAAWFRAALRAKDMTPCIVDRERPVTSPSLSTKYSSIRAGPWS